MWTQLVPFPFGISETAEVKHVIWGGLTSLSETSRMRKEEVFEIVSHFAFALLPSPTSHHGQNLAAGL